MGIGVSYIGNGERREFELDGVPPAGSLAANVLGAHPSGKFNLLQLAQMDAARPALPVPEIPSMADESEKGKVKVSDGDIPEVLSRKMMPNGSVVANGNTICLRGEEGGTPGGKRVYASADGIKGFLTLNQIDPYSGGTPLAGTGDTADGASAQMDGRQGASMRVGGRSHVAIDIDPKGNRWLVVKDFYRMADVTPNGRVTRVSKEVEVEVLRTIMGGSANGTGGLSCPVVLAGANSVIGQVYCNTTEALECFWRMVTGKQDGDELTIPVTTADYVAPYDFSSTGGYLDLWDFMNGLNEAFQQVLAEKSTNEKQLRGVVASCVSGLYAVRPIWTARSGTGTYNTPYADQEGVQYSLYALDFGTEAQLATWAGDKYLCDYDEEGELRETPVVKRLYVSSCPAGRSV